MRHFGSQPLPSAGLQLTDCNLTQKKGDSQISWEDYLQENNKSDSASLSLTFSQLGERLMMILMMLAMMVIMINMMSAFTTNTNKGLNASGILG